MLAVLGVAVRQRGHGAGGAGHMLVGVALHDEAAPPESSPALGGEVRAAHRDTEQRVPVELVADEHR